MSELRPRIRVLHVITRMIQGGAQENTLLTVEGLNRDGRFEVDLASGLDPGREGELLTRARKACRVIIVPELCRSVSPAADLAALWKLYRLIRRGRYHVVHTHSSKAGVVGRVAARLAGTPLVVHTLHGLPFHDFQPRIVNLSIRSVKRLMAPFTDHFIAVADRVATRAIDAGIGTRERFSTIYSGMELEWFLDPQLDGRAVRSGLGIPGDALVVGKVARLFPLKGHDQLLDAAPAIVRAFPGVRFLLVGDGILREHLDARARELGIREHVVFAGLVPRERIPEHLAAMDVVVHTSLREGLARVLPQALAAGRPCVAVDLDGTPEVVIPGRTGLLVPPGDAAALAGAVVHLLGDARLRRDMGNAGRRLVDPTFRAETMAASIAALYERLLDARRDRARRIERRNTMEQAGRFRLI